MQEPSNLFPSTEGLEITCSELQALREAGATLRLVDCREEDEWQICRIEGAELAPLSSFAQDARQRFTEVDESIVIYCHHGMRSSNAAHFLRQKGFPRVWSLAGGIEDWACEIEPGMARY